jgi:hypothetical protein
LVIAWLIYSFFRKKSSVKLGSSGFNRTKQLTRDVLLEKTHAGEYNLNDKDGFGLVFGKVLKLAFDNTSKKGLYVEYRHAKSDAIQYALIDLETLEVKNISAKEIPISLAEIETFY